MPVSCHKTGYKKRKRPAKFSKRPKPNNAKSLEDYYLRPAYTTSGVPLLLIRAGMLKRL